MIFWSKQVNAYIIWIIILLNCNPVSRGLHASGCRLGPAHVPLSEAAQVLPPWCGRLKWWAARPNHGLLGHCSCHALCQLKNTTFDMKLRIPTIFQINLHSILRLNLSAMSAAGKQVVFLWAIAISAKRVTVNGWYLAFPVNFYEYLLVWPYWYDTLLDMKSFWGSSAVCLPTLIL